VEQVLESGPAATGGSIVTTWKSPAGWLLEKQLGRSFWVFFTVAFFFDLGFSVYFFLFNLYLLDFHFNVRIIGFVGGALTLGSVAGTLPVGWLARRFGLRAPLVCCMIAAPLLGALRAMAMWEWTQIGLAFLAGLAMCIWGVCFPPMLARLTTTENRASAFSLIFSVSIGSSALGGLVCGCLPLWLNGAGFAMRASDVKRMILLVACAIALIGLIPLLRLKVPPHDGDGSTPDMATKQSWKMSPFLLRFLPSMALWTAAVAAFTPFANVYLSQDLHISLAQIGLIFSLARVVQLCVGLLTPPLFRKLGLLNGIVATQVATAVVLACLAGASNRTLAVTLFLSLSAAQWMSSPGLYNLLMSKVPERERSSASAMTMFFNAITQSCAMAGAGMLYARIGYPRVFAGIAGMSLVAALLFKSFDLRASGNTAPGT
jgi:MFS family permease